MSKIGEKPIVIPESTEVFVENNTVRIKGKLGELALNILNNNILIAKENNTILVKRKSDDKKTKSLHGLIRSLINNAVLGVNKLWEKRLQIAGTGYRVKLQGEDLIFEVGYSHPIIFKKIKGITFSVEGVNKIVVKGIDKQLVGQTACRIKLIKKPDPYKGKGIRYENEQLKLKPGKKTKTTGTAK